MKKILMIGSYNFLTSHDDGGRQESYKNYSILCKIFGDKNVFLCLITNDDVGGRENVFTVPSYQGKIQQIFFILNLRNGYGKKAEKEIVEYIKKGDFDYVWLDRSTLGGLCAKMPQHLKKIVFFHNIEINYIRNKIRHDNIGYLLSYPAFYRNEKTAVKMADKVLCLNERDSRCLNSMYGREADFFLPVSFEDTVDIRKYKNDKKITGNLLFVGSYFAPNIQGITWFIEQVMSKIPNIMLTVVGKGMEKKAKEWNSTNINVVGTVSDLSQYYQMADAVVLPILYGDGMKVKTAEALMYGMVIFGTKEALEGYDIEDQPDIFECNTDIEFIKKIGEFYQSKKETCISKSNRKLFLDKYENKSIETKMRQFFERMEDERVLL